MLTQPELSQLHRPNVVLGLCFPMWCFHWVDWACLDHSPWELKFLKLTGSLTVRGRSHEASCMEGTEQGILIFSPAAIRGRGISFDWCLKKDQQAEVMRNKFELGIRKSFLIFASREGLGKMVGGLPVIWKVCPGHHRAISTERTSGGVGQRSSSYSTLCVETWWILESQTFCYWCGVIHSALRFSCSADGSSNTTEERQRDFRKVL